MEENPVNSMLLLWLLYAALVPVGMVAVIFLFGFPALFVKWTIEWIKRGLENAKARREAAPE